MTNGYALQLYHSTNQLVAVVFESLVTYMMNKDKFIFK